MSVWRFFLGLAVGLVFSASPASAILIEIIGGKNNPVGGFVIKDDGKNLTIRIPKPGGRDQIPPPYRYDQIKILYRLKVKILEDLSKDNPKGYYDYAVELAREKEDPEARETALRLYLIAAKLAPDKFGASSLLKMCELANTSDEDARRYKALAFVLDPKAGAELLDAKAGKPAQPDNTPVEALKDFTEALRLYRAGQITLAEDKAKKKGMDQVFSMVPDKIDQKTFLQWCDDAKCKTCQVDGKVACPTCNGAGTVRGMFGGLERCPKCANNKRVVCPDCGGTHVREPLPDQAVRVVLRSELWAMERQGLGGDVGPKEATEPKGWSTLLQSRRLNPVLPLTLETITDFDQSDLKKCLYRNGRWVEE